MNKLQLGLALAALTGCATLKPYIKTADDVARALCAAWAAEHQQISVEQAFDTFCAIEANWRPFLPEVKLKQQQGRDGVTLGAAAAPGDCSEVPADQVQSVMPADAGADR